MMGFQQSLKRLADMLCALGALILLWPFLLVVALAVALDGPGGVFFTQPRIGRGGRPFKIYKFRSMRPHPVDYQNLPEVAADCPYLTRLGCLLRRYGIDELPQLLNILRGDMSLVGPRPTIQEQVEAYTPFQRRRLEVRPGLTGLAQISGNTSLSWDERILLDIWYLDHWSPGLDLRILSRTVTVVFLGRVMGQAVEQPPHLPSLGDARQHARQVGPRLGAG